MFAGGESGAGAVGVSERGWAEVVVGEGGWVVSARRGAGVVVAHRRTEGQRFWRMSRSIEAVAGEVGRAEGYGGLGRGRAEGQGLRRAGARSARV